MGNCFNIGLELKTVHANKIKRFSTPVVANKECALCALDMDAMEVSAK